MSSPNPVAPSAGASASSRAPRVQGETRADRTFPYIVLAGLVVLGVLLRVFLATRGGLWRDETLAMFVSRLTPFAELLRFLRFEESHPPGYYLVLRWWGAAFGHTETAALAMSIGLGVALIPLVFVVGERFFGRWTGVVGAATAALAPPLIQSAILVRPYAWLALWSTVAAWLLWRCLRSGDLTVWAGYAATVLVMLLTHNWALLVLGAHWVVGTSWILSRPPERRPALLLRRWLIVNAVIVLLYLPWVPTLWYQFQHAGHLPLPRVTVKTFLLSTRWLFGFRPAVAIPLLALIGVAGWRAGRRTGAAGVRLGEDAALAWWICAGVPLTALAAAAILSRSSNLLVPWCVTIVTPLAGLAVARLLTWTAQRGARPVAYAGGAALVLAYGTGLRWKAHWLKSNAREIAALVTQRGHADDLVVITPQTLASSFNFYFKASNPQIDYPAMERREIVQINGRMEEMQSERTLALARARLDESRSAGRSVWLVMEAAPPSDSLVGGEGGDSGTQGDYSRLTRIRSSQLLQHLVHLYGKPTLVAGPPPGSSGLELLTAYLFQPPSLEQNRSP